MPDRFNDFFRSRYGRAIVIGNRDANGKSFYRTRRESPLTNDSIDPSVVSPMIDVYGIAAHVNTVERLKSYSHRKIPERDAICAIHSFPAIVRGIEIFDWAFQILRQR